VAGGVDFGVDGGDDAVRSDEVADSFGVHGVGALTGPIEKTDLPAGIAQQREVEVELLREGAILFLAVEADAEDLSILLLVQIELVAEPAALGGSAGGVGLGIEPEDDVLPPVLGEADDVSLVVAQLEIGRRLAFLEHESRSRARESRLEAL
jgi:hypothetical protein